LWPLKPSVDALLSVDVLDVALGLGVVAAEAIPVTPRPTPSARAPA
jgi:hypothetical protein